MKSYYYLLLLLACCTCSQPQSTDTATTDTVKEITVDMATAAPDSLLRHVVMFSFKEDSYPDGVMEVENAFRALPKKIAEIHDFEWGTNNSPEGLNEGLTHCFFVTFASEADRSVYLPHPAHQAFVEVLKPHLDEVLVLDYWAKE